MSRLKPSKIGYTEWPDAGPLSKVKRTVNYGQEPIIVPVYRREIYTAGPVEADCPSRAGQRGINMHMWIAQLSQWFGPKRLIPMKTAEICQAAWLPTVPSV